MTVSASCMIADVLKAVISPAQSFLGTKQTKSAPTRFIPRMPRMIFCAWRAVNPPTSGSAMAVVHHRSEQSRAEDRNADGVATPSRHLDTTPTTPEFRPYTG